MKKEVAGEFTFNVESRGKGLRGALRDFFEGVGQGPLLPRLLRLLGAVMIFSCASIFLFQRWGVGNDIQRYLLLLGFTFILTAGGFFCGLKLKESKGARTLLGLTLAVTPVNFAVLAGLVYSQFPMGAFSLHMPRFATWVAPSPAAAIQISVLGAVVLAPLCYISFLTMGRKKAVSLTLCFLFSNLMLLVPTRQPDPVGVMVLMTVAVLIWFELRHFRMETSLKTLEGGIARSLMWVTPLLLAGRTGYFYRPSVLFTACALAAAALLAFIVFPPLTKRVRLQKASQVVGALFAVGAWFSVAFELLDGHVIRDSWVFLLLSLPVAALLALLSRYAVGGGRGYRRSAALVALAGVSLNMVFFPGLFPSFICMITAVIILVYGYMVEQKILFFLGLVGVVGSLGYHLKLALRLYSVFNWGSLAITGVAIIILASVLERHQGRLTEKVVNLRQRFEGWSN